MSDTEKPIADEATVLKGENQITILSGDGRVGKCDVIVNGIRHTFATGKKITVSDAQLDVLRNSGRNIEELSADKKGKAKGSSDGEADAGGGSSAPSAASKKATAKSSAKKVAAKQPASNTGAGGGTTKLDTPGANA